MLFRSGWCRKTSALTRMEKPMVPPTMELKPAAETKSQSQGQLDVRNTITCWLLDVKRGLGWELERILKSDFALTVLYYCVCLCAGGWGWGGGCLCECTEPTISNKCSTGQHSSQHELEPCEDNTYNSTDDRHTEEEVVLRTEGDRQGKREGERKRERETG